MCLREMKGILKEKAGHCCWCVFAAFHKEEESEQCKGVLMKNHTELWFCFFFSFHLFCFYIIYIYACPLITT